MNLDTVTIKEFEDFCDVAMALKAEIDTLENEANEKRKTLLQYQRKIQSYLEYFGKDSYPARSGNIESRTRTSVKIPKSEEDKKALFEWLKEKGIFYETASVNSATLNALYKAEFEAAVQEGRDCVIPGVGEPEVFTTIILKPNR